jgi:mRNA-degrading endonuclease RelE of RelBE toxin-antitoxin system
LSRFAWEPSARADLCGIDQAQAVNILPAPDRFAKTGVGDVRKLTADKPGCFRFRIGNWRIIFQPEGDAVFRVYSVDNRKDAYRS